MCLQPLPEQSVRFSVPWTLWQWIWGNNFSTLVKILVIELNIDIFFEEEWVFYKSNIVFWSAIKLNININNKCIFIIYLPQVLHSPYPLHTTFLLVQEIIFMFASRIFIRFNYLKYCSQQTKWIPDPTWIVLIWVIHV